MLVIISVASLSSGGLEVCVQRPQHHANASRIYRSSEQVRATLLKFGVIEKAWDEVLKLLPQLAWIIHEVSSQKSKDALKG